MREDVEEIKFPAAMTGLLCCRYLAVFFGWLLLPEHHCSDGTTQGALWALGVDKEGQRELLGVWSSTNPGAPPWQMAFADLTLRGVECIRFMVGNDMPSDGGRLRGVALGATALPSIEQTLAVTVAQVAPRHRGSVGRALRAVAAAGSSEAAGAALRAFDSGQRAERYPQIVAQWRLALAQWAPLFALPAALRRVVVSGDRMAANLHGSLVRSVGRHGCFADQAAALDFVAGALLRAERRLDRERAVAVTAQRIRRVDGAGGQPALGIHSGSPAVGARAPR